MIKVYRLLLSLLFIATLTVHGQTNYRPGSVRLQNGQQVNGLIDYREWRQNPRTINFKKDVDDQVAQYGIEDMSSFIINDQDSFERAIVMKDTRPVEFRELIELSQASLDTIEMKAIDTVFLRILSKGGKVELYELVDTKPHYYIREQPGDYKELQYRVYYDHQTSGLLYRHTFRNELQRYVYGHKEEDRLYRLLEKAQYNERDLLRVIAVINDVKLKEKKRNPPQFFVAAGPVYSTMKVEGPTYASDLDYGGKLGYSAGVGMDIVSKRNLQDFTLRIELFYSSLKFEGESGIATYNIKQNNITPAFALLYSFLRKPSYKVYVGGGLHYSFSSYPENKFLFKANPGTPVTALQNLTKDWFSASAQIGGMFNKIEVSMLANIAGTFERYAYISLRPSIYTLRMGYRFAGK